MELNRLKHCLSLVLTVFLICTLTFVPLAQDFSLNNSSRADSPVVGVNSPKDAVYKFTGRIASGRIASESNDRVWQMTGPFGGDVAVLAIDPRNENRILIGSGDGQIFSSIDGGTIWKRLRPGIRAPGFIVTVIHFDREKPNLIYAGVKPQTEVGDENALASTGSFFISEDNGDNWREVESLRGRAVRSFSQSSSEPKVMAIAASNGIYRSADRGNNWELITSTTDPELRGFHSVAIDPRDANAIYVGTHHLPWKTLDGGKTWKRTGHKEIGMIDDSDIFSIQVDPENPNTVMMSACSGIYRSRDAGTGWTKFQGIPYSARRTHMVYRHPTKPETIFAGTTEGLWISTEDGKPDSWRQVTSAQLVINSISIHPSLPDRVFLGTQDNGVLISLDGGETYEASNAGFINRQIRTVLADSKERGRIYAGVIFDGLNGGLFVSEDGGLTWQQSMNGMGVRDVYSLHQSPTKPETIYAGTNHGLFRSDDHGRNWAQVKREQPVEPLTETTDQPAKPVEAAPKIDSTPKPATRPRVVPAQPNKNSVKRPVKPVVQARAKQAPAKNSKAAAPRKTSGKTVAKTSPKTSPKSKKKVEPPPIPKPVSDRVDLQSQIFAIVPFTARVENPEGGWANSNWMIVSTWDGLFFSDDEKKGWKPLKVNLASSGDDASATASVNSAAINSFATSPHAPGVMYIATRDGLFVSRDNGANFRHVEIDPDVKSVRSVVFDPRSAETIYLGTPVGFFRSMDAGKTWEHRGGGMPQMVNVGGLVVSAANPDELYLYDEIRVAVFHSKDRGKNWDKMDISQLPSLRMLAMIGDPFDSHRLYAGSYSGGVYVMSRK